MARGYPDYFGQSIWPKYGTPIVTGGSSVPVAAGTTVTIVDIDSTGVLFAASILTGTVGDYASSYFSLYVDDQLFWRCFLYNAFLPPASEGMEGVMRVTMENRVAKYVHMALSREIPFKDSVQMKVTNGSASEIGAIPLAVHYIVT